MFMIDTAPKEKLCADEECKIIFEPTRHNQKYCSKDCCKRTTNKKIMQQYYENKDRKSGKKRLCKKCKTTALSRYNEGTTCQSCLSSERSEGRIGLLQMVGVM